MTLRKLVYIVSDIDKSLHFEWITPYLKQRFALSFILIGKSSSALEEFLTDADVPVFVISYARRNEFFKVWMRVFVILFKIRPEIIHTHLWIANLAGLTAGFVLGVKKRIYTRHHATIHHREHPSGRKWDRLSNMIATDIIATSKNIKYILVEREKVDSQKVKLIYHGFQFSYFTDIQAERIDRLHEKYQIDLDNRPVIGVISRLMEWKGVQFVIPAFAKLRSFFPDAHLILANAHGPFDKVIDQLLKEHLPPDAYTKTKFEGDVSALYRLFDVFVHVPVDPEVEAFGQTYVESLIAGIPSIFTLSGIAREFIVHEKNALVVGYANIDELHLALRRILTDSNLRDNVIKEGKKSVANFSIERYLEDLENLYCCRR